jgi:hypothetical protein
VLLWKNYTTVRTTNMRKTYEKLYEEIENVLDKWEEYGYSYFIKKGKCPKKK